MNILPLTHCIQWQAQLAIDRGVPVIYNARAWGWVEAGELEQILNG